MKVPLGLKASLSEDSSARLGGKCLLLLQLGGRILFKSGSTDIQQDGGSSVLLLDERSLVRAA